MCKRTRSSDDVHDGDAGKALLPAGVPRTAASALPRSTSRKSNGGESRLDCSGCDQVCCRTTALEIDAPRSVRDWADLLFYLYHFDTELAIAQNGRRREWFVQLVSPCRFIDGDGRCTIYEWRPDVCREYEVDTCERSRADRFTYIRSPQELLEYLEASGRRRMLRQLKAAYVPPGGFPLPAAMRSKGLLPAETPPLTHASGSADRREHPGRYRDYSDSIVSSAAGAS